MLGAWQSLPGQVKSEAIPVKVQIPIAGVFPGGIQGSELTLRWLEREGHSPEGGRDLKAILTLPFFSDYSAFYQRAVGREGL